MNISKLTEDFKSGQLSKEQWTHEAHLAVGFYFASRFSPKRALTEMKQYIIAHNERVGTPNSDTEGYHETITYFWLLLIQQHIQGRNEDIDTLFHKFTKTKWAMRDVIMEFYTRDCLFSAAARKQIVEPDIKPISHLN